MPATSSYGASKCPVTEIWKQCPLISWLWFSPESWSHSSAGLNLTQFHKLLMIFTVQQLIFPPRDTYPGVQVFLRLHGLLEPENMQELGPVKTFPSGLCWKLVLLQGFGMVVQHELVPLQSNFLLYTWFLSRNGGRIFVLEHLVHSLPIVVCWLFKN